MAQDRMTTEEFRKSGLQIRSRSNSIDYKAELLRQIREAGLPEPEAEFKFHPERKWRFDFAFVEQKVAVEYDGGIISHLPSHSSVAGIHRDIEKGAEAQLAGWVFLRVTPQLVANGTALRYVKKALEIRASRDRMANKGEAQKIARELRTLADRVLKA